MSDKSDILAKTLKDNGYSITNTRKLVYRALLDQEPIPMSNLIERASATIDRASIYRTIELFEQLGIIRKLYIGWKYKIELSEKFSHHHHHITCIVCGTITAFEETKDIRETLNALSQKAHFTPVGHQIELTGICARCHTKTRTPA